MYTTCFHTLRITHALHRLHSTSNANPNALDDQYTDALDGLGLKQLLYGSPPAAHRCFLASLREKRRCLPPGHWEIVKSVVHVARALVGVGRAAEAEALYRWALGGYAERFGVEAEETGDVRGEWVACVQMVAGGCAGVCEGGEEKRVGMGMDTMVGCVVVL
tara:strand:+ start:48472 stop:48957 length:486 start_codon:yes stop_codon:yes gene_type:complete